MPEITLKLTLFGEYFKIGETTVVPYKSIIYINISNEKVYLNRNDEFGIIDYSIISSSDKEKLVKSFTDWLSKNGV